MVLVVQRKRFQNSNVVLYNKDFQINLDLYKLNSQHSFLSKEFSKIQNRNYTSKMNSQNDIFLQVTPQEMVLFNESQKIVLKDQFVLDGVAVELILTDSHILLAQLHSIHLWYALELNFSVKFDVLRTQWENQRTPGKPLGICFEKQNSQQKIEIMCNSSEVVCLWAKQLEKKINQRNFHKLFKATRKLGKGAFATVYLAQSLVDGKMVAVKAFSKEKQYSGEKGRESLQNEIKIMRILDHQNVVKLQGIYETQNSVYVILEYLQGLHLNEQIKNHRSFSLQETKEILRGLLCGISHLASKRIIHRDLKPQNIMFRRKNSLEVAICDFGLATHADEDKYLFVRCGTPGFVAPEIINIKDLSHKSEPISDVFSAGVIFHHLLFNKSIFEGTRYNDILAQNRTCDFDFTKEEYSKLNFDALDLLKKMLEKIPQLRITAEQAVNHPFLRIKMEQVMQIEEPKLQNPENLLKEMDMDTIQTPSTLKSDGNRWNLRRRNSNPLQTKQSGNKQNQYGILKLKKAGSNISKSAKTKNRSCKSRMADYMDLNL